LILESAVFGLDEYAEQERADGIYPFARLDIGAASPTNSR
jgi:hypothetical protein